MKVYPLTFKEGFENVIVVGAFSTLSKAIEAAQVDGKINIEDIYPGEHFVIETDADHTNGIATIDYINKLANGEKVLFGRYEINNVELDEVIDGHDQTEL